MDMDLLLKKMMAGVMMNGDRYKLFNKIKSPAY